MKIVIGSHPSAAALGDGWRHRLKLIFQQVVNGLLLGGIYACIGMGFSLVYGVMGIINMAHGSLIMLGAYITYQLFVSFGIDPFLSIPASALMAFAAGYLIQSIVINRVIKYGLLMTVVLTFGIDLMLINAAVAIWTPSFRAVTPEYVNASFKLANSTIPYVRVAVLGAAFVATFLIYKFLQNTKLGKAIRATALNREAAELVGVNIRQIYAVTYGTGAAMAAIAGSMFSVVYAIYPFMGVPFLGKAFAVAVLGGLGNVTGALAGGLILGLAESFGSLLLGPSYQQAVAFLVFLGVLIVRPQGIMGQKFFK